MALVMVVPCYNEATRLDKTYWTAMLQTPDVHWLFVDDGSTDSTAAELDQLALAGSASVLQLSANSGKAEAVRKGLLHAMAEPGASAVGFIDADGAFDASEFLHLTHLVGQKFGVGSPFQAVWTSRVGLAGREVSRSAARHYVGRIVATYLAAGLPSLPYDTQCGLKFFRSTAQFQQVLTEPFLTRWLFEIEICARWLQGHGAPLSIWEEPLDYWREVAGSRINLREMRRIASELFRVKLQLMRAIRATSKRFG